MRKFKSVGQAQRFVSAHAAVSNLFSDDTMYLLVTTGILG
jgi:hypothetical protein